MRFLLSLSVFLSFTIPLFSDSPSEDIVDLSDFGQCSKEKVIDRQENFFRSSTDYKITPKVNPVTGEYDEEETDLVVAGAEPLSSRRYYNHFSPYDPRYASWRYNPESFFVANFEWQGQDVFAAIGERNGSIVSLKRTNTDHSCFHFEVPKGFMSSGFTGQNHPLNTEIKYEKKGDPKDKKRFRYVGTITDGSGKVRSFVSPMHRWTGHVRYTEKRTYEETIYRILPNTWTPFQVHIDEEKLPNGNILCYHYTRWKEEKRNHPRPQLLQSIVAYNCDKTKILNTLTFHYPRFKKNEVLGIKIIGSDGRKAAIGHSGIDPIVLTSANRPDQPPIGYGLQDRNINRVEKPEGRVLTTEYQPNSNKVSAQYAPVGPNGEMHPIGRYEYQDRATICYDAEGQKTVYHFDAHKQITAIESYQEGNLHHVDRFTCDSSTGNLLRKTLEDGSGSPVLTTEYQYDKNHNPIIEKISNQEESYTLNRTYSDDGFNLKLSESDGFGKTASFSYVPGTNLLAQELLYDGETLKTRTSYTYDDCAICIQKTVDDSPSATYCTITRITPRYEHPCFGLPETVEELTLDANNQEILLGKVNYTYHPSGKILTEVHYDANNQHRYTLANAYDDRERLVAKSDALGHTTNYAYDANNNLIAQHGPRKDMFKSWSYDRANRPIQETERTSDGRELITRTEYDKLGRAIATTDPFGNKTSYNYDVLGRVTCTTHPDGAQEFKEHDLLGNVTKEIDPLGHITTCSYTLRGKPKHVTHPDDSQESFTYNPDGTLHTHIDQNGATTVFTHDIFENPLKQEVYSSGGELLKTISATYTAFAKLSETDPEGITTYFTYDKAGRKISETFLDRTITYSYDALGNLTTTEKDDIQYIDTFDHNGQILQSRTEDLQGTLMHQEDFRYDPAGNRTHVITSKGVTESTYDPRGQILWTKDPLGRISTTHYSYTDHLTITTQDPKKLTTITHYDKRGRPLEIILQNGQGEILHKESKGYDLCGNQILTEQKVYKGTTYSETITHSWWYGPSGRIEKMVESDQKQTLYAFDNHGRVETITKPTGVQIHHRYDDLGRLKRFFSSSEDIDYHYNYDSNDNLLSIYDAVSDKTTQRQYDPYGNLIQEELANGLVFQSSYDTFGKRTAFTLPDQSRIEYTYKAGELLSVNRNGQSYTYQTRDLEGEISQITLPKELGAITYTRDALSRIKEQNAPHYSAHFQEDAYDAAGNLCHYSFTDPLGEFNASFSYDTLNQLTLENGHSYTYDSLGNRLQKDSAVCTVNNLCQITSDGEKEYTYDANGNLLTDGEYHYFYDSLDRLIRVTKGPMIITFTYDPLHRRLTKQIEDSELAKLSLNFPGVRYSYLWDGENEIGTAIHDNIIDLRILGEGLGAEIGAACFFEHNGKSYVPIHDHRGALVTLIDMETGEVEESYRYTAFGEELTDSRLSPWRFSSKRHDEETGLIFFGRRYYRPHLGRWITADPQGFEDGPNLYAYLHNCPLLDCDLYGLSSFMDFLKGWDVPTFNSRSLSDFRQDIGKLHYNYGFENPFKNKSHNYDLNSALKLNLPDAPIGFVNGIGTSKELSIDHLIYLSKFSGTNIHTTYNADHGPFNNLRESTINLYKKTCTNPVENLQRQWEQHAIEHPGELYMQFCHSQGTIHVKNALEGEQDSVRKLIRVVAIAPAAYIPKEYCESVRHYVSERDLVPFLDRKGRRMCRDTIITLKPHKNAPLLDHSFRSPTYASAIRVEIAKFMDDIGGKG